MPEPDWAELKRISAERLQLQDAGRWDKQAFQRLWKEAEAAVKGNREFLESLSNYAEETWFDGLG